MHKKLPEQCKTPDQWVHTSCPPSVALSNSPNEKIAGSVPKLMLTDVLKKKEKLVVLPLHCDVLIFFNFMILPLLFTSQLDFTPSQNDFAPVLAVE